MADGRILLAFNDSTTARDRLRLAVSSDEGQTWSRAQNLAEETGAEFSYPFLLQTSDEIVHVVYTWKRRAIRHAQFIPTWLKANGASRSP